MVKAVKAGAKPRFQQFSHAFGFVEDPKVPKAVYAMIVSDQEGRVWRINCIAGTMRPVTIERAEKRKRRSKK